jgi:hypothetical protein
VTADEAELGHAALERGLPASSDRSTRKPRQIQSTSGLPPIADMDASEPQVRFVPILLQKSVEIGFEA